MAEIALIAGVLPKLISLLEARVKLHSNIRRDLGRVKRELEHMKAFLLTAEATAKSSLQDEVWVNHVRETAFESEDALDEFMLHFTRDHLDGSCSCLGSMIHSFKNVGGHHQMASRIKDIIDKFSDQFESSKRYHVDKKSDPNVLTGSTTWQKLPVDLLLRTGDLIGIQGPKEYLKKLLVTGEGSPLKVISVFGAGGVGKTSLVKMVYDLADVKEHVKCQAWITISQTPEIKELFKDLVQQICKTMMQPDSEEPEEITSMESGEKVKKLLENMKLVELQRTVWKLLEKKRYMIVVDDVCSIDAWNAIKTVFPDTRCGSQLVITTRHEDVARTACDGCTEQIYNLDPLSREQSFTLFKREIFGSNPFPDHLAEVSESILKKCGGLPLAIVSIAGVLKTKDSKTKSEEWGRIDSNLQLKDMNRVLSVSYKDLPYQLKPCYLYLGVFPEDHLIQKMRLIRLWIAEGFVEKKDNMTHEEVAESYLKELLNRCLIQVADRTSDGRVETLRIHDLLRDVIIEKARNQNFATIVKGNNSLWPEKVRRLSLHNKLSVLQQKQNVHQLRSLFTFEFEQPVNKSSMPALFSNGFNFKLLSVLDMQGTKLDIFPSTIVKLRNLKYLNLSRTDVKEVPSSIGRLQKLETLDLKSTRVSKLPVEISKLKRLRNLLVYHFNNEVNAAYGFRAPKGIKYMWSLQNLCFLEAGKGCGNLTKELGMLTELRRLGITNLSNKNAEGLCNSLSYLRDLRVLSISFSENENQAMDLRYFVCPSNSLQRLYLTGKLQSLPERISSLQKLVKIYLKSSQLENDPLELLGRLPNLVQAELVDAYMGTELRFRAGKFQNLKILGLSDFQCLLTVVLENQTMPKLERFRMENCKLLEAVPSGTENLSKLVVLDFVNMPTELMPTVRRAARQESVVHEVNWIHKDKNTWKIERLTTTSCVSKDNGLNVDTIMQMTINKPEDIVRRLTEASM